MEERYILGESVINKAGASKVDKVEVEANINDAEDGLFTPVPYIVDVYPCLVDLEPCGNPNNEDADVDDENDEEDAPFQALDMRGNHHEETDTIDDDLEQKLNLENPKEGNEEEELKTRFDDPSLEAPCNRADYHACCPVCPYHHHVCSDATGATP